MLYRGTSLQRLRIVRLPTRMGWTARGFPWMTAGRSTYASSSYQSSDDGNGMDEKNTDTTTKETAAPSRTAADTTANGHAKTVAHPFMPVINMPENEFAHHAFFALYRPLLGLSAGDDKPFYASSAVIPEDEDEALTTYMMDLQPFEPPNQDADEDTFTGATVTCSLEDDQAMHQLDQNMPMYHMPDGEDVVDYLAAMQEKMKRRHALEEQEEKSQKQSKKLARTRHRLPKNK